MAKESGAEVSAEKTLNGIWDKKFAGGGARKNAKRKKGSRKGGMARKMAAMRAMQGRK